MKKFEVGRRYNDKETQEQKGTYTEIEIVKRTQKTVTFKYTMKNWRECTDETLHRRKIQRYNLELETIELADYQTIYAK